MLFTKKFQAQMEWLINPTKHKRNNINPTQMLSENGKGGYVPTCIILLTEKSERKKNYKTKNPTNIPQKFSCKNP